MTANQPATITPPFEGLRIFTPEYTKALLLAVAEAAGIPIAFEKVAIEKMADILKEKGIRLMSPAGEITPIKVERCETKGESELVYIHQYKP